jgi:hypothetical protein
LIAAASGGMIDEVGIGPPRTTAPANALVGIVPLGMAAAKRALASRWASVWAISMGCMVVLLVVS